MQLKTKRLTAFFLVLMMIVGLIPGNMVLPGKTAENISIVPQAEAMNADSEYTPETDPEKFSYLGNASYSIDASKASGQYAITYNNNCKWLQINARKYDADWLEAYSGDLAAYTQALKEQAQGAATLAGAEYTLYYYEGDLVVPVATAVTDANGYFSFLNVTLARNYFIQETKAAPGYQLDPDRHYINYDPASTDEEFNAIEADAYTNYISVFADSVQRAPIQVIKRDSVLKDDIVSPQGDATLAQQHIFEIKYLYDQYGIQNSNNHIYSYNDNKTYSQGEIIEYITTDQYGVAQTSDLPYGWYQVTEVDPPEGYTNQHFTKVVPNFNDAAQAALTYISITDEVERGFLNIRKADIHDEFGYEPEGDATLIGAEFTVQNSSAAPVTFSEAQRNVGSHTVWKTPSGTAANGDYIYNPGADICAVTTFNESGDTDILEVPFGTYTVRETVTPRGYLPDADPQTVSVYAPGARREILTEPVDVTFKNTPCSTTVKIDKKDIETWDTAQGDGKINDMTVAIINRSKWAVYYEGNVIEPGEEVCRLLTDEHGYVESDPLPYGTYEVIELVAPYGYEPVGEDVHFLAPNYDTNGKIMSEGTYIGVRDPIQRGTLRVSKYDTETGDINQGDATFVGTTFEIYNSSRRAIYLSTLQKSGDSKYVKYASGNYYEAADGTVGSIYTPGELICTVVTDEKNGTVSVDIPNLPFGEYEVVETVPPRGYYINDGSDPNREGDAYRKYFQLYDGLETKPTIYSMTYANAEDSVKRGKFTFTKTDDYTTTEEGSGTLGGAEFTVINRSMQPVFFAYGVNYIDDPKSLEQNLYYPGEVVQKIYTDDYGYAETGMLPYGTYEITETGAPEGYLIGIGDGQVGGGYTTTVINYEFSSGIYGDIIKQTDYGMMDSAIRGDLSLQKKDQKSKTLKNVVFRITSETTGESHILVTDENGEINTNSSKAFHSYNTNINDAAVADDGTVNEALLDPTAGVWFTGLNPQQYEPIDARGALPYDTYLVEELRSSANIDELGRELKMLRFEAVISAPGFTVNYGTLIDDNPVVVESILTNHVNGSHIGSCAERETLDENVVLHSLTAGEEYTIKTVLVDSETGDTVVDTAGNEVSAEYTFTALSTESNTIIMKLIFDSSELAGRTVVATDAIYKGNSLIAIHDLDTMDEMAIRNQSVSFPGIRTALRSETGNKIAFAGVTTIVDTVDYFGLEAGIPYQLEATLMVKSTGKLALDPSGNIITAKSVFVPETINGKATVVFENVDLSKLEGDQGVCFETLTVYPDGKVIAVHEDINDDAQTITIPMIRTYATNENYLKSIDSDPDQTIIDTITYTGLEPGVEYEVTTDILDAVTLVSVLDGPSTSYMTASDTGSGTFEVPVTVDATELAGKTVVVFENISKNGEMIAEHADGEDDTQYVYVPDIRTFATTENNTKTVVVSEEAVIVDTVLYENLVPGETYIMKGRIYNKDTGEILLDASGAELTTEYTFVPNTPNGNVTLTFTFDAKAEENHSSLVAFETLYEVKGDITKKVGDHEDESDEDQSVTVPWIGTTATGTDRLTHDILAENKITIVDTVEYDGLLPGQPYTVKGILYDKATGAPALDNNEETVTAWIEFVPETTSGTVELTFVLRDSNVEGKTFVAFEELYTGYEDELTRRDVPVVDHKDINDEGQTVHIPKLSTNADDGNGFKAVKAADDQTIIDHVTYENLIVGQEYQVSGTLYNKRSGLPLLVNGDTVTSEKVTFFPETPNGSIDITFVFDASALESYTLVAFEDLESCGQLKGKHHDIDDEDQTIYIPKIRTSAESEWGIKEIPVSEESVIRDTVAYWNLIPGENYIMRGTVYNKDTGKMLKDASGEPLTTELAFVPERPNGYVELTFTFDANIGENRNGLVVFENLYEIKGNLSREVAEHADENDEDQFTTVPWISTTATDTDRATHDILAEPEITIVDTVVYEGLIPGNPYTLKGIVYDKETGAPALDDAGNTVTAWTEIIPETPDGSVELIFTLQDNDVEGKTFVVFEELYLGYEDQLNRRSVPVVEHEDINDEGQTVHVPKLTTSADDGIGFKQLEAAENQTVVDIVTYENLIIGKEYHISGILYDKATGKPVLVNGEEVKSDVVTVIPDTPDGSVAIKFEFDASELEDFTLVAFEDLESGGQIKGEHHDIDDEDQTVYIPKIRTTALSEWGTKEIPVAEESVIRDTVAYWNLIPGETYLMRGTVYNKDTGEMLKNDNGDDLTTELEFVPDTPDGYVELTFTFDANDEANRNGLVVFETLYDVKGTVSKEVAIHADENDDDQFTTVPWIRTTATGNDHESHDICAAEELTIIDTVRYQGLIPGNIYTLKGYLYNKATGEKARDNNGNEIAKTIEFTPEFPSGYEEVVFTFADAECEGKTYVAFEELYLGGVKDISDEDIPVVQHSDISDEEQTVHIPKLRTHASNEGGLKAIEAAESQVIIDIVSYENLIVGNEYTITGELWNKDMNSPLYVDGENVTAEVTFTAEQANGSVELKFELDSTELEGATLVACEDLTSNGKIKGRHKDLTDEDQTVYVPKIRTTAKSRDGEKRLKEADSAGVIIDTVAYQNLVVGETYVLTGTLMEKNTGEPLYIDGSKVTGTTSLTVTEPYGTIKLEFDVDNTKLDEGFLVAFETVTDLQGKIVARHEDVDDEDQSVYTPARLRTTAAGEKDEKIIPIKDINGNVTVIDTVEYSGLVPGREYTVTATMMFKDSGEPVRDSDGKAIVSEPVVFIPDESDGEIKVPIEIPAKTTAGKHVVAFEKITIGDLVVGTHEDLEDDDQTVLICYIVKLYKYNGLTNAPMPEVTFIISDRTGANEGEVYETNADMVNNQMTDAELDELLDNLDDYSQKAVSGDDGYFQFAGIPGHEYVIREVKVPEGFRADAKLKVVTVNEDGTAEGDAKIMNLPLGTVEIAKYDALTNKPVPGAEIEVYDPTGKVVCREKTGEDGKIRFLPTCAGKYTYKEIVAPKGYYLNPDVYTIQVMASDTEKYTASGNLSFVDAAEGVITVTKLTQKSNRLAGATIGFYTANGTKLGSSITDENGHAYFQTTGPGQYYFVEESAPAGYIRTTDSFKVNVDANKVITGTTNIVNKADPSPKTGDETGYEGWKAGRTAGIVGAVVSAVALCARAVIVPIRKKKATDRI